MKGRVALLASLFSLCLVAVVAAQVSTVEGTVVSSTGGSLVIDTSTGQRTFMVDAQSSLPANLAVGSRVKVEYHTLANDKFHAFKVTTLEAAPTTTETTTTRPIEPAPTTTRTEPMPQTTTTTTTDDDDDERTRRLPATASPLPLLALMGGLALAGGALVRRLRS